MNRFADDGKLGHGFTSADDLVEVDIGNGDRPRPTFVSAKLDSKCKQQLLGVLNVTTKSTLSFLILITAPKMLNLSLIPLNPSCHPQHDMRDTVLKYAIALLNK